LAEGSSVYADDAAYRAYVLAGRLGDEAARARARELMPPGSVFARVLGDPPAGADPAGADALAAAAAQGGLGLAPEARSAPEAAGDVAAVLDLAEALQSMDEYRQSSRAGRELLAAGVQDLRAWRLAYPPAWPETVLSAAAQAGVEPALVWAVMRQESAFSEVA